MSCLVGSTIVVTCETSTLTHYMVVREGDSTIFLATYTDEGKYHWAKFSQSHV